MSLTRINTNTDALMAGANLKKLEFSLTRTMSHLSSGLKLVNASDGPSEMGLMGTMNAQVSGMRVAIANAEDTLSLCQLADSSMLETQDMLIRMRDLAVRAATDATITTAQRQDMEREYISIKTEMSRKHASVTFNTKQLFSGGMSNVVVQLGPDNTANQQITIQIPTLTITSIQGVDLTAAHVSTKAGAQAAIDKCNSAIVGLGRIQTLVGVQERLMESKINELNSMEVNVTAAASRIKDADMAFEISNYARQQVLAMAATAMIAQANAQPQKVMSLLGIGA